MNRAFMVPSTIAVKLEFFGNCECGIHYDLLFFNPIPVLRSWSLPVRSGPIHSGPFFNY